MTLKPLPDTKTGAFIFGCSGPRLTLAEAAFFAETNPWGFILFARNINTPDQLRQLTGDLRSALGRDAPILIDQEGGRVERMSAPTWRTYLPPLDQVAANPAAAARSMYLRYRLIAHDLRAVGIDVNCAPCADIARPDTHPVLRNRLYGDTASGVSEISRAVAQAHFDGGVLPVIKHMPGHGRASLDSHLELPRVTAARADLDTSDFAPFRALSDLPMGMSAHIVFEGLGESGPATTSARMINLIRNDIGFGGLLMSDDLSMQALSGTPAERAAASINAGIDVILHCNGDPDEMAQVAAASGAMTPAASRRAAAALARRTKPGPIDIAAMSAELEALISGRADG